MDELTVEKKRVWKYASWVFIILAIFLAIQTLAGLKALKTIGRDVPAYSSITVTGTGEVVAIPDVATFNYSVVEEAKTVAEAQTKATEKSNDILAQLKSAGIEEKDLKTLSYNIYPKYQYTNTICTQFSCPPSRQILTGYEVSQTIQVKVRETGKAGDLLTTVGELGVSNASGLSFSVDDTDALKQEASAKAIEMAQVKAKQLAKELDVKLVKVIGYYDSSDEPRPYFEYGLAAGYGGDSIKNSVPEIPTGESTITARVNITYEIR